MGHVGSCWAILGPCWCILGHPKTMMDQHGVIIAHLGSSLGLWGEQVNIPRGTGLWKFKKHTKTCVKVSIPGATGSSKSKKHTKTCVKSTFSKATSPLNWDNFERGGPGMGRGWVNPSPGMKVFGILDLYLCL